MLFNAAPQLVAAKREIHFPCTNADIPSDEALTNENTSLRIYGRIVERQSGVRCRTNEDMHGDFAKKMYPSENANAGKYRKADNEYNTRKDISGDN
jgi:hypothetical protein